MCVRCVWCGVRSIVFRSLIFTAKFHLFVRFVSCVVCVFRLRYVFTVTSIGFAMNILMRMNVFNFSSCPLHVPRLACVGVKRTAPDMEEMSFGSCEFCISLRVLCIQHDDKVYNNNGIICTHIQHQPVQFNSFNVMCMSSI